MNPTTPHPRNERPKPADLATTLDVHSQSGDVIPARHLRRIEELDDVIFAALNGNPSALDKSARLYRQTSRETPPELLDESRDQYQHRAESIVEACRHCEPGESLAKTFAALEILTLVAES